MAEGTIKRLTDKGFGFIDVGREKDLFFHSSSLEGVSYDDLREGQRVTFNGCTGTKRPLCRERPGGVATTDLLFPISNSFEFGGTDMGDKGGSKDKGKREKRKKAKLNPKEKRKSKKEKKNR